MIIELSNIQTIIEILFILIISSPILAILHYEFWLNEEEKAKFDREMMFWHD